MPAAVSKPIYGMTRSTSDGCNCVPDPLPSVALTSFLKILSRLRTVINQFYNPFFGVAQVIGSMTMSAKVSTPVFIRFKWIESNPNTKFNKTNPTHLDDIKFLYNIYNKDWKEDPLFKAMAQTQTVSQ